MNRQKKTSNQPTKAPIQQNDQPANKPTNELTNTPTVSVSLPSQIFTVQFPTFELEFSLTPYNPIGLLEQLVESTSEYMKNFMNLNCFENFNDLTLVITYGDRSLDEATIISSGSVNFKATTEDLVPSVDEVTNCIQDMFGEDQVQNYEDYLLSTGNSILLAVQDVNTNF
mmetsp:Transcript_38495/g.89496  ORF Transcript_38495/g.89496 Transcript_38495/m.89496 type:complete len:170 (-) Transcript_38495:277-786(-)